MPNITRQPFHEGYLPVGEGHRVYFSRHGERDAPAWLVLHGGPGSGCRRSMLDWFDLDRMQVVLLDQRGAGRSLPAGETRHNRTTDLVEDIERLRLHLDIPGWRLAGGSWGAALALCYADRYPRAVRGAVLRGAFLASDKEIDWFFQSLGALAPAAWAGLTAGWPGTKKRKVLQTLTSMLQSVSPQEQEDAARRWGAYEEEVMQAMSGERHRPAASDPAWLSKYRLQCWYLGNACFLRPGVLLRHARRLRAPVILLHGTHDWICPPANAMLLARFMPEAELRWVAGGCHGPSDPVMLAALRQAIRDLQAGGRQGVVSLPAG